MKVSPKNDEVRRLIYHPTGNIHFHAEGAIDWPDDSYTARRIRDGDVTVVEAPPEDAKEDTKAHGKPRKDKE